METKEEVIHLVFGLLSQMREGITGFVFHEIVSQSENYLIVRVSYTWSLNGHKKPVNQIERSFYKEGETWKILA